MTKKTPTRSEIICMVLAVRDAYLGSSRKHYCLETKWLDCDGCEGCFQYENLFRGYEVALKYLPKEPMSYEHRTKIKLQGKEFLLIQGAIVEVKKLKNYRNFKSAYAYLYGDDIYRLGEKIGNVEDIEYL